MRKWLFFPKVNYFVRIDTPISSICSSIVTLNATSNGYSFQWSQVSGLPVVITSPNTLNTTVNLQNQSGPFVLRLTINNDPSLFAEVTVETLPSDRYLGGGLEGTGAINVNSGINVCSILDYSPSNSVQAYFSTFTDLVWVTWSIPPGLSGNVSRFYWQENINGTYQTFATFNINDPRRIQIYPNRAYKVITEYNFNGIVYQASGCRVYLAMGALTKLVFADENLVFSGGYSGNYSTTVTNVPDREVQEVEEPLTSISFGGTSSTVRTLDVQIIPEGQETAAQPTFGGIFSRVVTNTPGGVIIG